MDVEFLEESTALGAAGEDGAGEAFCARAAGVAATTAISDKNALLIIVFMSPSQSSIIVQRPKAVKAIPCARSSRYRTFFGRK